MLLSDFTTAGIVNFTPDEIIETGAKVEDIELELMIKYQQLRNILKRPIHFVKNGLTTGKHKSHEHPLGMAGDCFLHPRDGAVRVIEVVYAAIDAGFTGIGVYYNSETGLYSFHLDIGPKRRTWTGYKNRKGKPWKYKGLINDPRIH